MAEKKYEFECAYCKKNFDNETQYHNHRDKILCMCDFCGVIFTNSNQINQHLSGHTSNGTFKCFMCPVTTNDVNLMQHHITLHQKKLFICIRCGANFSLKQSLIDHFKIHNEHWECDDCSFTTTTKKDFEEHNKEHENPKRFYSIDEFMPIGVQLRTRDKNETIFISKQYF